MNRRNSDNLYFGLTGATAFVWDAELSLWGSLDVSSLLSHIWVSSTDAADDLGSFDGRVLVRLSDSSEKK